MPAFTPFVMGSGDKEARMQPVSMYFIMKNVDLKRLADWARIEHAPEVLDAQVRGRTVVDVNR